MLHKTRLIPSLTACIILNCTANVFAAETPPPIPARSEIPASIMPGIDPGYISRQLSSGLTKSFQPLPAETTKIQPTAANQNANANQITFELNSVEIVGNTAISTATLEKIFAPYLHKKISLAELMSLTDDITSLYRSEGYILSRAIIPPQTIKGGHIKIQVLEGFIQQVKPTGAPHNVAVMLQKYGDQITQQKPLNSKTMQRYLLLMNDIPGVDTQGVISPDPNVPLASQLKLATDYKPFQASLYYDNFASRYYGNDEFTANMAFNSIFWPGGTLYTRTVISSQTKKLQYFDIRHDQLIGANGFRWVLDANYGDTNPAFVLEPLDIHGISKSIASNFYYPFIRSTKENLTGRIELNYLDSSLSSFGTLLYFDRIRSGALGLTYDDNFAHGDNHIDLKYNKGFNILGANNSGVLRSRIQGVSNFNAANLTLSRNQYFTQRYSLYGMVTSQYATAPLLAAEEMTFGGAYIGRGFELADLAGDRGIEGTLEFRVYTAPDIKFFREVQYYAFYDDGTLWNLDAYSPDPKASASSLGFGARINMLSHLSGNFFVGKPITNHNSTLQLMHENSKDPTVYFQLAAYL